VLVEDREDEPLLLAPLPAPPKQIGPPPRESPSKKPTKELDEDELTEDEESTRDAISINNIKSSPGKNEVKFSELAPPPTVDSRMMEDEDVKPGIIISKKTPLQDFKNALTSEGDIISEAVVQFADVIKELVVAKQFPNRRKKELLEGMKFLRATCLKVMALPRNPALQLY
jgi:hypothetical protein